MGGRLSLRSSTSQASSHVATLQSGTYHVAWRHSTTDSRCSMLLTVGLAPFVRRRCDCLASSAPFTNTQTYLLTLAVQISLLISPVWLMAVKVSNQVGLHDEEGLVADLCCSSVQLVVLFTVR